MTMPPMDEQDFVPDQGLDELMGAMLSELELDPFGGEESTNDRVAANEPEPDGTSNAERVRAMMEALYGDDFPLLSEETAQSDEAWASWARRLWSSRRSAVEKHMHLVQRNRMMRAGNQWISSSNGSPWSEPPRPKDSARIVHNMIDKALDQRLQVLTDQRPGFSIAPSTQDPDDKKRAYARQVACEFQYDQMGMASKGKEAAYWAQTDGVAFWHVFWNPDRGPWDERLGENGSKAPMGDLDCRVLRVEQVRVSPEATVNVDPSWVVVRDVISRSEAVARWGYTGAQAADTLNNYNSLNNDNLSGLSEFNEGWVLSHTTIGEGERLRNTDTTERYTVYLAPQPDILPQGLEVVVVGNRVVFGWSDLQFGAIPIVAVRDGSSDPSYYPRPIMEQWLESQMRMNALVSKWYENIRVNSGGRFFARPNTVVTETFLGGVTSMIEVKGAGGLSDSIQPFNGFSVGNDVKEAFALEKASFEDASGYNAISRGQVTGESGRAIIASREQLERVFAPPVQALAMAFTAWCKVSLAAMGWGYDLPRSLGTVGRSRPDLAREITGSDLDGSADVRVEPATMMPMPLSFRLYMLDNWLQSGVIDLKEYRRRQMFAVTRDIGTPDEDQEARARRVTDALLRRVTPPEMRWQDNEAIHQDVLERDIILQDDIPQEVIAAAQERWMMLAQQAQQKMVQQQGPMPGAPGGAPDGGQGNPSLAQNASALPPSQVPLSSSNPPTGATQLLTQVLSGTPDAEQAARMRETRTIS
jgi:hypothetical protein